MAYWSSMGGAREEGIELGREEARRNTVQILKSLGIADEVIAEKTGYTLQEISEIN